MATPRKHWFEVTEDLCSSDLTNEQLGMVVRIMSLMNNRRARNSLSPAEASKTVLSNRDATWLAGRERLAPAWQHLRKTLAALPHHADTESLTLSERSVEWPKLPELQRWIPETRTKPDAAAREVPSPTPTPTPTPTEEKIKSAVHAAAPSAPEPDRLPEEAPTREQAKAAKAKLEADVNRALNVLLDQQGGLDEKRLWLRDNLRACEEWAKANSKQFRAALLSWWRNYAARPERPYREQARKAADKAALHEEYRKRGIDPYEPHGVPDVPKEMLEAAMANVISFGGRR